MLEYLYLAGAPAFSKDATTPIGPLKPINFIFGPNGCGKTTISRALCDPNRFPGTTLGWMPGARATSVLVYNCDYVAETIRQVDLPGVFLLGKKDADILTEIEELDGPSGSIAATTKRLADLKDSLARKLQEIDEIRDTLKESAWAKRAEVPTELESMFIGYNNNKENLLTRLLEAGAESALVSEDFEVLRAEAAAVLKEDAIPFAELPTTRELQLEDESGFDLLATPVVGSEDVRLAPLIQQLQNADWVEHGRNHLIRSPELCPFCQQKVPADLTQQLDAYFDQRYSDQVKRLHELKDRVETWAAEWRIYAQTIPNHPGAVAHLNTDMFQVASTELDQAASQLVTAIEAKLSGPSSVVDATSPTTEIDRVNALVAAANDAIRTFNLRLQGRAAARKDLLARCWVTFTRRTLATEFGRYEGAMPALVKGKNGIEGEIAASAQDLAAKQGRLRDLQSQVTSSKPIIEKINQLLDAVGFNTFRLIESPDVPDAYCLVREDGEVVGDTLSEGERTFITFLYFAQSLEGAPQDAAEPNDLIAVIDDPISSLDSEVLYAVSTLVRRMVTRITTGSGRVRQLVLLTHNAHFHREVTYPRPRENAGDLQYGIVRKRRGRPSEVLLKADNPIQTAYGALWDEVRRAEGDPSTSISGFQNTLRRIIETYFRVLGGVDVREINTNFEGEDQTICQALFSWMNAGSHSIFDALEYSPTPTTVEANLRVFRKIFEVQDQGGHYRMMMRETDGSPTGSIDARAASGI